MCTLELVPVPCPCCAEWINHEFPPFWTSPHAMINGETNLSSSLLIQFPGMFIDISVRMEWFLCILTLAYYFLLSWPLLSHCSHCRDFSPSWQDQRSTKFVGSCKVPWLPPSMCVHMAVRRRPVCNPSHPPIWDRGCCLLLCLPGSGISLLEILLSQAQEPSDHRYMLL